MGKFQNLISALSEIIILDPKSFRDHVRKLQTFCLWCQKAQKGYPNYKCFPYIFIQKSVPKSTEKIGRKYNFEEPPLWCVRRLRMPDLLIIHLITRGKSGAGYLAGFLGGNSLISAPRGENDFSFLAWFLSDFKVENDAFQTDEIQFQNFLRPYSKNPLPVLQIRKQQGGFSYKGGFLS